MYRYIVLSMLALLLCGFNMSANAENQSKTLVIYLTRTQNNKILADFVAKKTAGDLAAIELVTPYPDNYQMMRDQVVRELADGTLPALKNQFNIDHYQRIIIIFPTWAMRLPPPIKTFLQTYDLQNKIIMPLNTNAGYGVGSGFDEINQFAANADVKQGLSLQGGNERDGKLLVMQGDILQQAQLQITTWLQQEGQN